MAALSPLWLALALQLHPLPEMGSERAVAKPVGLRDGQALLLGGCAGTGCSPVLASAELFDPRTRRFTPAGAMHTPRVSHAAVELRDGRVLIAGGWTGTQDTAEAEVFDPATRRFERVRPMAAARQHPVAALLPDGRVLVAGGGAQSALALDSAEVFDPATGAFAAAARMNSPRTHHAVARLRDGRVLIAGGLRARGEPTATAELYDAASGRFEPVGSLSQARYKHAAVTLADGRVMVIGGSAGNDEHRMLASTEIFDPASGRFSPGPPLRAARFKIADSVAVRPDGSVVVAGGASTVEVWTPGEPEFRPLAGSIEQAWMFNGVLALPTGDVLIAGGYDERIRSTRRAWLARAPQPDAQR